MIYYPLKGFNEKYFISKTGKIKNSDNHIISPFYHKDGYLCVSLHKNAKKKNYYVHRLVAIQFLPKIKGKNVVDHINKKRTDNTVKNLRWCSITENNRNREF